MNRQPPKKRHKPSTLCSRCHRRRDDRTAHPVKMWGQWQCMMKLVGVRKLPNGDSLTYVPDSPYPSTKDDRKFWVHPDRFGY